MTGRLLTGPKRAQRPGKRLPFSWSQGVSALLWIAPAAAITSVYILGPVLVDLLISIRAGEHFDVTQLVTGSFTLDHYAEAFGSLTIQPFVVTTVYVVCNIVASVGIALWIGLLVSVPFRGRSLAQAIVLVPWAIPGVVFSVTFLWILNQTFGVLNSVLLQTGVIANRIGWLSDTHYSLAAVLLPTIWKTYPLAAIILIAALKAIPKELYEVASVDGASPLQRFRYITLPLIRGSVVLVVFIVGLLSYNSFDFIYALTRGGPLNSTETLAVLVYNEAFQYFNLEKAAALSIVVVAIGALWVVVGFRWLREAYF